MLQKKLTALVLGANGLIGQMVTDLLLKNEKYETVFAVSRKGIKTENPKLVQIFADINNIEEKIKYIKVDQFFSCIGSTKAKSPNKEEYYRIDHEYPLLVARCLKENGCRTVCLVSSIGANAKSKNFYLQLKGKVEQSFKNLNFDTLYIFQPSLLIGKRKEKRFGESLMQAVAPILNVLMTAIAPNYKSISAKTVAKAMLYTASHCSKKETRIFETEQIKQLA